MMLHFYLTTLSILALFLTKVNALSQQVPEPSTKSRRNVLQQAIITSTGSTFLLSSDAAYATSANKQSIASRIYADSLTMPPPSRANGDGIDNVFYPEWMNGCWDVTQTLTGSSTPLGLKFIGGPAGSEEIAAASFKEQQKQLNVPVSLKLRFVKTKFGVAEDRLFNTKQRLNNFAGRSVVSSVEYANVGMSNRASTLAMGGSEDDPLQTTIVRFKGPAAQKTFMLSHGEEYVDGDSNKFATYETLRSIFALTNQSSAPPVTTDSESIWLFDKIDNDNIRVTLRIASYLNAQSDTLYFDAKNISVAIADYTLVMKKCE